MPGRISRSRRKLFSARAWHMRLVFWLGALLVGFLTVMFVLMAKQADRTFLQLAERYPWMPFIVTPLGLMLISYLTRRFFPGAEGSGVPQTIAALQARNRSALLSFRIAIGKILMTIMGLFSGASIGVQGPSVHIGASILYSLRRFAHFPKFYRQALIAAGGAAGFAAAFNTPLAGIVFAFEEIRRNFEHRSSGIVMIAVILSGMTAIALQGNLTYFGVSDVSFEFDPKLLLSIVVCAVVGGLLGGLFSQGLISGSRLIAPWLREYPLLVALGLGLLIALIGHLSGYGSSGTGYEAAYGIVTGSSDFDPWFPLYKFLATLASYFTGIPGGIFAPSLATGAGLGMDLAHFLPLAPVAFMVMVTMVAYFSGVIQAPITSTVIVLEMTANHNMIFPLMISAFIGYGISTLVCPRSLFRVLADAFFDGDSRSRK